MSVGAFLRRLLAVLIAAGLHVLLLNTVPQRRETAAIEGGSLRVELGLDAALSTASKAGAEEAQTEQPPPEEPVSEPEEKPAKPSEQAPFDAAANQESIAPVIPAEPEPRAEPAPEPEAIDEVAPESKEPPEPPKTEDVPPPVERLETTEPVGAPAEQTAPSLPEGGAASTASVGAKSGDAGPSEPTSKPGNAASQNYAGQVMEHLSKVRRPRASGPGSTFVAFTIAPSGELESVRITKSSGSSRFDREAQKVIERAAPFPKPPEGVNRDFVVEIEGR
ncbi:MAG: TonB family protein [Pseudomonadota bacterium]